MNTTTRPTNQTITTDAHNFTATGRVYFTKFLNHTIVLEGLKGHNLDEIIADVLDYLNNSMEGSNGDFHVVDQDITDETFAPSKHASTVYIEGTGREEDDHGNLKPALYDVTIDVTKK